MQDIPIDPEQIRCAKAVIAVLTDGTLEILWGEELMRWCITPDGPERLSTWAIFGVEPEMLPALADRVRQIKSAPDN